MLKIIYDRNFKENRERTYEWHEGEELREIAPHRIIELHADGAEKAVIDEVWGSTTEGDWIIFYGDLARTVYLNLLG